MTSILAPLLRLDRRIAARLALSRRARCPVRWLRLLALAAAHSGDSPLWLLAGGAAILWGDAMWRAVGWRICVGTLAAGAATTVLKWLFHRRRPPGESRGFYTRFDRHAFPSGHAGRSACLVVLLFPLLPAPWGACGLPLWLLLVGVARVALQVHFPSDIVGGWIVGGLVGAVLTWLIR